MSSLEQESLEEFCRPITPSKHHNVPQKASGHAPDSPNKLQARSRLGSLLGQIRKRDMCEERGTQQRDDTLDYDEEIHKHQRGKAKKIKREKRVVFELRGKPFGLRDSEYPEPIYALCRKWMYGKDDEKDQNQGADMDDAPEFEVPQFKSLDLLATKEIHVLPLPRHDIPLMDPRPQRVLRVRGQIGAGKTQNAKTLLAEYKKHWKSVKKNWNDYNRKREQRYADSLQLLRTVYGIAQQTQL